MLAEREELNRLLDQAPPAQASFVLEVVRAMVKPAAAAAPRDRALNKAMKALSEVLAATGLTDLTIEALAETMAAYRARVRQEAEAAAFQGLPDEGQYAAVMTWHEGLPPDNVPFPDEEDELAFANAPDAERLSSAEARRTLLAD